MKKIRYAILSLSLLTSCSVPSFFLPSIAGNDVAYLPRPMGADTTKTRHYLSGSIAGLAMPYSNSSTLGMLNYNHAYTEDGFSAAYGVFGWAGKTETLHANTSTGTNLDLKHRNFYGGGFRTSFGLFETSGNTEFRYLSWESALSYESGSYKNFRREMYDLHDSNIISSTKNDMFTTGGATEIIWHGKKHPNNQFAFRLFMGATIDLGKSLKRDEHKEMRGKAFDLSFYMKVHKVYGIVSTSGNKGLATKFSLGYAF